MRERNEKFIQYCSWKAEVERWLGRRHFNIKLETSSESSFSPYLRLANISRKTQKVQAF